MNKYVIRGGKYGGEFGAKRMKSSLTANGKAVLNMKTMMMLMKSL